MITSIINLVGSCNRFFSKGKICIISIIYTYIFRLQWDHTLFNGQINTNKQKKYSYEVKVKFCY